MSSHSEDWAVHLMPLLAKKVLSMLMLSKVIGKVSTLCSSSSKDEEPRETVFVSSF